MVSKCIYVFSLLIISCQIIAQETYEMKGNDKYTEIDILSSYYEQDGNNAAVTGGIGTEQLTDVSSIIVINVPLNQTKSIQASFGADYYTSASTDNIDNNRSSASSKDIRAYANLGFTNKNLSKANTWGARMSFSNEYDYTSVSGMLFYAKELNEGNTELSLTGQMFFDQWRTYYPVELRGDVTVPTKQRQSYNAQLGLSQVINPRLQMSVSAEAIYMTGLLSTPFHRVYFNDAATLDIERLPESRLKIPLSLRLNYKPLDKLTVRTYYRFYTDDFGINGHTASLELPVKLNDAWTVYPFYRYHTQTAADYFAPFETHSVTQEFYTSDYDLSALSSQKYGMGIQFSPVYGLARMKLPLTKKVFKLNSISLRGSRYTRDTGLNAFSIALNLNIRI